MSGEARPWERDADWWRDGAPDPDLSKLMAEWKNPDQHQLFKPEAPDTDPQGRPYASIVQAYVEGDGTLRLTVRRYVEPARVDKLVMGVLLRLGTGCIWTRVRKEQGTHAPTVEWWRWSEP